jgi:hypothetical protein
VLSPFGGPYLQRLTADLSGVPECSPVEHQPGLYSTLDEDKIDQIWTRAGDAVFNLHKYVPLFWLPTEVTVNPNIVGDYLFPGSISGSWTHVENIKAARQQ